MTYNIDYNIIYNVINKQPKPPNERSKKMKKLTLVKVPENRVDEFLDKFFCSSAFTFEGIDITDKKGNKELEKALREAGYENEEILTYWFNGAEMNKKYHLTGSNAYPDDLTFLVIPHFYNPIFKMSVGARWFDDIVDNNARRQAEIEGVI